MITVNENTINKTECDEMYVDACLKVNFLHPDGVT